MLAGIVSLAASDAVAQFLQVTNTGLPNLQDCSIAWGDYNKDGYLDLLVAGNTDTLNGTVDPSKFVFRVYRNNGDGTFTDINAGLTPLNIAAVAWGDYDNDGYLDIVASGSNSLDQAVTLVYHNNGNGTFTLNTSAGLIGMNFGGVAWGDFNNDGYLDILQTGILDNLPTTKLYRNNKNGTFTEVATGMPGVNGHSKVAWGDYNNDGNLDILLCGRSVTSIIDPQPMTKLFKNNGDGTFTEVTTASFVGVWRGAVAWGDYDNDGYADIIVTGLYTGGATPRDTLLLYKNHNGDGTFVPEVIPAIINSQLSSVAWGDYNGDGFLDILINGTHATPNVLRNKGDGTFAGVSLGIPITGTGAVAWGDMNNDGYLDIVLAGNPEDSNADTTFVFRYAGAGSNPGFIANTKPNAPTGLNASVSGGQATLTWNAATDAGTRPTPSSGLTYNLRIGSTSNGIQRLSPLADTASGTSNGFRRVVRMGGVNEVTSWNLQGLKPGNYYWAVQAIDNAFAGSPFSAENYFNVPDTIIANVRVYLQGPYVASGDSMANGLRVGGYLATHFTGRAIPALAVDSIRIEVRDSLVAAKATKRRFAPAWLLTNGSIRSFSDTTKAYVGFDSTASGLYYIAVQHRNHLAIIADTAIALNSGPIAALYDFSTGQDKAYGTNPMAHVGTRFAMYAGDVSSDGVLMYNLAGNDRAPILARIGGVNINNTVTGYYNEDTNLDGTVQYNLAGNDRAIILFNIGGANINQTISTQVP